MIFPKRQQFRMGYLSGFYAEKRDIEYGKELQEEVQREVEKCTQRSAGRYDSRVYTGVHVLSDHIRTVRMSTGRTRCFRCGQ